MKFILIIFSIFLLNTAIANDNDNAEIEVIDLYATKTLDQMVLDDLNNDEPKAIKNLIDYVAPEEIIN